MGNRCNCKKGYALVTGASSGIGREFAIQLAGIGYDLILVARREKRLIRLAEKLKECYGTDSVVIEADLSDYRACREIFDRISDIKLDLVINNAGFGDCGRFEDGNLDKELEMIDVNVKAMHIIMKLSLQKFLVQKQAKEAEAHKRANNMDRHGCSCISTCDGACGNGMILNVASSAGLLPAGPYMATYYATKSYVTSLTQAVAQEQKESGSGIYVGCLCPGPVDTEFNEVANVHFSLPGITARECVRYAISGMQKGQTVIVPGMMMRLGVFGSRLVPRGVLVRMAGSQQKKKL